MTAALLVSKSPSSPMSAPATLSGAPGAGSTSGRERQHRDSVRATIGDVLRAKGVQLPAPPREETPEHDDDPAYLTLHLGDDARCRNGVYERRVRGRWEPWPVLRIDRAGQLEAARVVAATRRGCLAVVDAEFGGRVVRMRKRTQ